MSISNTHRIYPVIGERGRKIPFAGFPFLAEIVSERYRMPVVMGGCGRMAWDWKGMFSWLGAVRGEGGTGLWWHLGRKEEHASDTSEVKHAV